MDFYLIQGSESLRFPINPEKITANTGARTLTFETIATGEISIPKGTRLANLSFEGFFPGANRQSLGILKHNRSPQSMVDQLTRWRNNGDPLHLLVTETPLNLDVFIDSFEHSYAGGNGDISYSLNLIQARALQVHNDSERNAAGSRPAANPARTSPPVPKTYTVRAGDTLYAIAKRTLGDGARWKDIYNLNKSTIRPDANLIFPGQVLRIPGGTGAATA